MRGQQRRPGRARAEPAALAGTPGVVGGDRPEWIVALAALLLLPVLALVIGRLRASLPFAVILVALGRSLAIQTRDLEMLGGALVIGAGLLYLALVIIRRPGFFPAIILTGVAGDALIRALGNSYDPRGSAGMCLTWAARSRSGSRS